MSHVETSHFLGHLPFFKQFCNYSPLILPSTSMTFTVFRKISMTSSQWFSHMFLAFPNIMKKTRKCHAEISPSILTISIHLHKEPRATLSAVAAVDHVNGFVHHVILNAVRRRIHGRWRYHWPQRMERRPWSSRNHGVGSWFITWIMTKMCV